MLKLNTRFILVGKIHNNEHWFHGTFEQTIMSSKACRYWQVKFFFFNSVLHPFQDYFSSYETGQSVGGAKTGEPREKPPDTPASRTWLVSHVARAGLEPTPDIAVRRLNFVPSRAF